MKSESCFNIFTYACLPASLCSLHMYICMRVESMYIYMATSLRMAVSKALAVNLTFRFVLEHRLILQYLKAKNFGRKLAKTHLAKLEINLQIRETSNAALCQHKDKAFSRSLCKSVPVVLK